VNISTPLILSCNLCREKGRFGLAFYCVSRCDWRHSSLVFLISFLFQVSLLSDIGGDLKEITYGILKRLLTNKLGCSFNMEGRNRGTGSVKKGFKSLASYIVVHGKLNYFCSKPLFIFFS